MSWREGLPVFGSYRGISASNGKRCPIKGGERETLEVFVIGGAHIAQDPDCYRLTELDPLDPV
jgi:hypothetical protein